jgi:DNA-binding response OmpR family regulator
VRGFGLIKTLFKGSAEPGASPERRHVSRIDARAGLRILIVDDSSTVVALLGKMLRQNGYEVTEAVDGEQAIAIATQDVPELVFLDIVLPAMSGFAVLRALRRDPRTQHVPVIMISGNLRATEEFYGQRIGADDFMKKPFGRTEVFNRIQTLVERGRLPQREGEPAIIDGLDPLLDDAQDELVHDDRPSAFEAPLDIDPDRPPVPGTPRL